MIPGSHQYLLVISIGMFFIGYNRSYAQDSTKISRQIDALIQEKKSRTPAEQKIDSQLLQAIRERAGRKMAEGLRLDPADVRANKNGDLMVDISADVSDELLDKIKALGGKIIYPSKQYHTIRAEVNMSVVETIAAYPQVRFVQAAVLPMHGNPVSGGSAKGNMMRPPAKPKPVRQASDSLQ